MMMRTIDFDHLAEAMLAIGHRPLGLKLFLSVPCFDPKIEQSSFHTQELGEQTTNPQKFALQQTLKGFHYKEVARISAHKLIWNNGTELNSLFLNSKSHMSHMRSRVSTGSSRAQFLCSDKYHQAMYDIHATFHNCRICPRQCQ